MFRFLLNVLWVVFGGLEMAIVWFLAGLLMIITIVGIPWARACFVMARFVLWPFGYDAIGRDLKTGRKDLGTGCLGAVGNVVWLLLAGIWLFLGHLASALVMAILIVGIPFAVQHLKLALFSLMPIGKTVEPIGR